jgi:hypothetical protein
MLLMCVALGAFAASLRQQPAQAIARLKAAQNGCANDSIEFQAAIAELQRLSAEGP